MNGSEYLVFPTFLTFLSFLNGAVLCVVFGVFPRVRRNPIMQLVTGLYVAVSLGLYTLLLPHVKASNTLANYWLYMVAILSYIPVLTYLGSTLLEAVMTFLLARVLPDRSTRRMVRWRRRLLTTARGRERRMLSRKLKELKKKATDPVIRRELIKVYLSRGELESALYHSYALVELLPFGHAHAFALYRLAQILVDQLGDLESAQPYLRRIIRGYPRSFFASYARRLVNQFEAYADREI